MDDRESFREEGEAVGRRHLANPARLSLAYL
jgi:hypothetical protein